MYTSTSYQESILPPAGVEVLSASPPAAPADVSSRWKELLWTCFLTMSWRTRSLTTMQTRHPHPSRSRRGGDLSHHLIHT